MRDVVFAFRVDRSTDGVIAYDAHVTLRELGLDRLEAGTRLVIRFRFRAHLARGHYSIGCLAMHAPTRRHLSRLQPAGLFTLSESRTYQGLADLEMAADAETERAGGPIHEAAEGALAGEAADRRAVG